MCRSVFTLGSDGSLVPVVIPTVSTTRVNAQTVPPTLSPTVPSVSRAAEEVPPRASRITYRSSVLVRGLVY